MSNSTSIATPWVGFGTAGLGGPATLTSVESALHAGFRKFDTAEADYWYYQTEVGTALESFFVSDEKDICRSCEKENLEVSTKIPPWALTSDSNIRSRAAASRTELVGFCGDISVTEESGHIQRPYPMDIYYIHAPSCWSGWHPRCENVEGTLGLRETWTAMEAVVGIDHSAKRIGLSNVRPEQLLDLIDFVKERQQKQKEGEYQNPPPRMPDVLQAYADPLEPSEDLLKICREHNIEFVSYSTLGTQHAMRNGGRNPVLSHEVVSDLSDQYGRSSAEVVLSWALQNGMSVIPRSSDEGHILELANLLHDPNFLKNEDVSLIDNLSLN